MSQLQTVETSRWRGVLEFGGWILLCFAAASVGARFMPGPWYESLTKPVGTPPNWVFGPVWTVLYLMMGIAAGLVWRRRRSAAWPALSLFVVQLMLNALWSYLFFGRQAPGWALVDLMLLWATLAATLLAFWREFRPAGILLLPYLAWTTFAGYLNFALWRLNS